MNWRNIDRTMLASVALHLAVLGWGLVSFQSKAFEVTPGESLPVDVISADQLAKVMAGMKSGKKENPKPLVEKVAEAKPPIEDQVGKITEKPPVVTEAAPKPAPPVEKPVEKKTRSAEAGAAESLSSKTSPSHRSRWRKSPIRRRSIRLPRRLRKSRRRRSRSRCRRRP